MQSIGIAKASLLGLVLVTLFNSCFLLLVSAQATSWTPPMKFFEVDQSGNVQSPTLLTDSGGNLHVFWGAAMTEGEPMALYYSRWQDDAWTEPIDVLLSPDGGNIWPFAARVDERDFVHVFWMSGGQVWHSMAHASQVGDARNWSPPDTVPVEQVPFTTLGLAQDGQGVWYLVYSNRDLDTISLLRSQDGAVSWDSPGVVYQEVRPDTWIGYPDIVVAPDGTLWVSWQEMEEGSGRSKGLVYTRSEDGGATWSTPEQLISGYYFGGFELVGDTMVKKYGGGIGTGGRFISFSYDNGVTWTEPRSIGTGGGEGAQAISLARDSADSWHFVVEAGMNFFQVEWDGNAWAPAQPIVSAETMNTCCITPGQVTENAVAGISDGNLMHVFFEQDNHVLWVASRQLESPKTTAHPLGPPEPLRTDVTAAGATPVTPAETSLSQPTPTLTQGLHDTQPPVSPSASTPVLVATLSALLIVGLVVALHQGRARR